MTKNLTSLGLMSGTSGDGIDASVIISDGKNDYEVVQDEYIEYENDLYQEIHEAKEKINIFEDLLKYKDLLNKLEKKITLFIGKSIIKILKKNQIDLIGYHGQTIFHKSADRVSKQLGNAELLSQLTLKPVVHNFRSNDLIRGGQGAPLTPIFHQLIVKKKKIETPVCILNIGGIANATIINNFEEEDLESRDIGPGNCLIDEWIRKNSKHKFDNDGLIASRGNCNDIIIEYVLESNERILEKKISLDTKDFNTSFVRGLSLEDGASTLTNFSAKLIGSSLNSFISGNKKINKILICGGGRKNKELTRILKSKINSKIEILDIDKFGVDGDFVESQAFAFLGIRSFLGLPITFPKTTGCKSISTGGDLVKNFK